jgi:general secretion pathway protein D
VNTVLRLKDGETQVLAGLINNQDIDSASKVPGLGDVPLLGRLFSNHKHNKDKTELILAITPHIIRNIHQPDADLASYWSGTDNTVRSRPITTEKIETINIDTKAFGAPLGAPGAFGTPGNPQQLRNIRPAPQVVPSVETAPLDVDSPVADPAAKKTIVVPNAGAAVTAPSNARNVAPPAVATPAAASNGGTSVPYVVPRTPSPVVGGQGLSDAVVDPAAPQ